jgi:hypothetical protein
MSQQRALLDPSNLHHVGLRVTDVADATAELSECYGLSWTPFRDFVNWIWYPDREPAEITGCVALSLNGFMQVEVTQIRSGPYEQECDLNTPHHVGYWSPDVMKTTETLLANGWTLECKFSQPNSDPVVAMVSAPSGFRVELIRWPKRWT